MAITSEEARAYARRWELVREAEIAELRRTPVDTKFRQLAALTDSRRLFGSEPDRESGVQTVRERWALLRQVLSA